MKIKLISSLVLSSIMFGCAGSPLWYEKESTKIAQGIVDIKSVNDYILLCKALIKTEGKDQNIIDALKKVKYGNRIRPNFILNKKEIEVGMSIFEAECLEGFGWSPINITDHGKIQSIYASWWTSKNGRDFWGTSQKRLRIVNGVIESISY